MVTGTLSVSHEVFVHISSFMDLHTLCTFGCVSKALLEGTKDMPVWENIFATKFPVPYAAKYRGQPPVHYLGFQYVVGWKALIAHEGQRNASQPKSEGGGVARTLTKGWNKVKTLMKVFTPERRVVLLGLEGSGKTSLLYELLKGNLKPPLNSQIGVNTELVKLPGNHHSLKVWDLKGHMKGRELWWTYLHSSTDLIIFAVDSSDRGALPEAVHAFKHIYGLTQPHRTPLLICATKQDLPEALSVEEVIHRLDFADSLVRHKVGMWRKWYGVGTTTAPVEMRAKSVGLMLNWMSAIFDKK